MPSEGILAAAHLSHVETPNLSLRVVNVGDLTRLLTLGAHAEGLTDEEFTNLCPAHTSVVFAHQGYSGLIRHLVHGRGGRTDFHVRAYPEEAPPTTPFETSVLNDLSPGPPPVTETPPPHRVDTRPRADLPEVDAWR